MSIKVATLLVEVAADIAGAARDLDQFGQKVGSGGVLGTIGKAGVAAFAGIGAAAGGMVGVGVKVAGDMEQAKIGFETMLGSAEQADVFLQDLKDFAVNTPFEMDSLVTGAQRLLAMGTAAEDVMPLLTSIGDAVAAAGGSSEQVDRVTTALGQMTAKGKASAEEMMQLTEAGIPAWDFLATKLGVDVPTAMDMVSKGAVDAHTAVTAFMEGSATKFEGAMDKQSQSLMGMFSTLKDTVSVKLGEALGGPVAEKLKDMFPTVQKELEGALDKLLPGFADAAVGLISALAPLVDAVAPIVEMVGEVFATIGPEIGNVISGLAPHVADLAVIFGELVKALAPLIPAAGRIIEAVAPVAVEFAGIAVTIAEALVPVIVKLVDLFAPFIDDIVRLGVPLLAAYKGFQMITGAVKAFQAISLTMTMSNPMLLVLGAVAAAAVLIITNWDKVWPVIKKVGEWFADVFRKIWEVVGPVVQKIFDVGKKIFQALWDGIKFVFNIFWTWYVKIPLWIIEQIWNGLKKLYEVGKQVVQWLWDGIKFVFDLFWTWNVEWPLKLLGAIWNGLKRIWNIGHDFIMELWNGIVAVWQWLWDKVVGLGQMIWDAIWGVLSGIWNLGVALLHGLWDGIVSVKDWIVDKVKWLGRTIINAFKSIFGIDSPSKVFAGFGTNMMEGLAGGITDAAGAPVRALAAATRGLSVDATLPVRSAGGLGILPGQAAGVAAPTPAVVINVHGTLVHERELGGLVDRALASRKRSVPSLSFETAGIR